MTEKRFIGSSGGVYDQYKNDRFAWSEWEEILQIMNNLNEKAIERSKALSKLQKENEQLKQFQEQVAEVIESKMGYNVCNYYKIAVLKEIWYELELDEVWFE